MSTENGTMRKPIVSGEDRAKAKQLVEEMVEADSNIKHREVVRRLAVIGLNVTPTTVSHWRQRREIVETEVEEEPEVEEEEQEHLIQLLRTPRGTLRLVADIEYSDPAAAAAATAALAGLIAGVGTTRTATESAD